MIDFGPPEPGSARLLSYRNVPRTIGIVLSQKAATLQELQSVYGLEDLFDLLEVLMVDNHNTHILSRSQNGERH